MKINQIYKILLLLLFITLLSINLEAKGNKNSNDNSLHKTLGSPNSTRFNINKIGTYIYANGLADIIGSNPGYFYPILGGHTANFQSGFLWGGYVGDPKDDQLRVGGSTYRTSLTPGRILPDGTAEPEDAPKARIFRVRKDYATGSLAQEAQDEGKTVEAIFSQYQKDWNEWPADEGAPYDDIDHNGSYNPNIDVPGVPGADQTIWFVANDLSKTAAQSFSKTTPMGIELQCTVWGYKQSGALGQMLFKKYIIVNKNPEKKDFNKFYVSYWSDTDIGGGSGDLSGCDTTKSLFYTYSGATTNVQYADTPPATGFDFFQGPRIKTGNPNDTAIFKGQYITGYKNMGLTAHYFFINGSTVYADPDLNSADGIKQWYNLFQGKVSTSGNDFIDPTTGKATKFTLYGDPLTGQGWVDSDPDDRRNGGVSGPFTLAYGDTQEVVIAQMSAGATQNVSNLDAVKQLKTIDDIAQVAYDRLFQLPQAAPPPSVIASALDQKIVLNWGENQDAVSKTENYNYTLITPGDTSYYNFQGYNVYQLRTRSSALGTSDVKRLKTFDIVDNVTGITEMLPDPVTGMIVPIGVQNGTNSGITRFLIDSVDAFTNAPFVNGTEYYFAVTSYSYNPDPQFGTRVLENPLTVFTLIPHSPDPGVRYEANVGQAFQFNHTAGVSDGSVSAYVVDPSIVTGHDYEVNFTKDSTGKTVWNVTDKTINKVLVTNQTNQSASAQSPIVDGLQIKVMGAPNDFKRFLKVKTAAGPVAPPTEGCFAFNSSGFPTSDGLTPKDDNSNSGPFADGLGGKWGIHTGASGIGTDFSYKKFVSRITRDGANFSGIVPFDFEIRFTAAGSKSEMAFTSGTHVDIPFEVWNIGMGTPDDPSDDYKLVALVNDVNGNEKFDLDSTDHPISGGDNDPETDWFYIYDVADHTPGTKGYDAAIAASFDDDGTTSTIGNELMARMVFVNWNGGSITDPSYPANIKGQMPEVGSIFRILSTKPNAADLDVFSFKAPTVSQLIDNAKVDVEKINVFPNPYYGVNPREANKYGRFVTFSHLPAKATIRIFNLAGQLVKTIEKSPIDGQFKQWNLLTDNNFPAASGLYIVHIDMPELGKTKILKVAIIQEQQILDHF